VLCFTNFSLSTSVSLSSGISSFLENLDSLASSLTAPIAAVGLSFDFPAVAQGCLCALAAIAAVSISRPSDSRGSSSLRQKLHRHTATVWVLAGGLLATALLWNAVRLHMERGDQARFESSIEALRESLAGRVERYEDALVTIRSALQVLGPNEVEQWDRFSRAISGKDLPPGIQFIGVFEMRPNSHSAAADSAAKDGPVWQVSRVVKSPDSTSPPAEGGGDLDAWLAASSDPLLEAVGRARGTGRLGVSPLAQRPNPTAGGAAPEVGFFVALPLAESGSQDETEALGPAMASLRRSSLVAFVSAPAMMRALEAGALPALDYQLFSGRRAHPSMLLDASTASMGTAPARLERTMQMRVGGQDWTLLCRPPASTVPLYQNLQAQILSGGLAATGLLLVVALRTDRRRMRTEHRAKGLARRFAESRARLDAERCEGEEALRRSEERYALAAQAALDGLWDWNLQTNEIELSPRWKALIGFGEEEIGRHPEEWLSRIHAEDRDRFQTRLSEHLAGRTATFECEYRLSHRDGGYRWMLSRGLAVRDAEGQARRIAGSQTDISSRRHAEKRLLYASLHDPLTGLPNRSHFMERLAAAVHNTRKQSNYLFALLFLDVDRFKVVNDSLGHLMGDELLVLIGRRLKNCLRPTDTIARLGGDEFAILLDDLHKDLEATAVAERIQKSFVLPFQVSGQEVFSAISIGITFGSAAHNRTEDLLRNADTAMYRAKAQGKARYELFHHAMSAHGIERLRTENDLRRGLENHEFVIYYQPIVSLASGQISGCEALVRWQHPERGLLLPDQFIPVAEETGHIAPLGEWLTQAACAQVSAWSRLGLPPLQLSINVSPRQFQQQDVFEVVSRALAESKLDPALLQLELTESALMDDTDRTVQSLVDLYSKGVQISLDDFGTGYSSLIYLRQFPISVLKISEAFVRHVVISPGDAAIASGMIALAHSLDLTVVVEGVETSEQLAFLQAKSCEAIQGHVVSRPLSARDFAQFLAQWRGLSVPV
jgi:diguanylate cyclase (GGDEF)-like protein/PAS domain S-box-containing protein